MSQNKQQRLRHVDKAKKLSIARQCELIEVIRSSFYYKPVGESKLNLELMRLIDEEYLLHPWLGVPRMTTWLREDKGYKINPKRLLSVRCSSLSVGLSVVLDVRLDRHTLPPSLGFSVGWCGLANAKHSRTPLENKQPVSNCVAVKRGHFKLLVHGVY